jgi:hypothetical protein
MLRFSWPGTGLVSEESFSHGNMPSPSRFRRAKTASAFTASVQESPQRRCIILDASHTLAKFMDGDEPNRNNFDCYRVGNRARTIEIQLAASCSLRRNGRRIVGREEDKCGFTARKIMERAWQNPFVLFALCLSRHFLPRRKRALVLGGLQQAFRSYAGIGRLD